MSRPELPFPVIFVRMSGYKGVLLSAPISQRPTGLDLYNGSMYVTQWRDGSLSRMLITDAVAPRQMATVIDLQDYHILTIIGPWAHRSVSGDSASLLAYADYW